MAFLAGIVLFLLAVSSSAKEASYKTYIIFLSPPANAETTSRTAHQEWHQTFLPSLVTEDGEKRLVCSYTTIFHGFAARLSEAELAEVEKLPGFLRALPDSKRELLTTRTPTFLGLSRDKGRLWSDAGYGRGVVIGILDSGIYGRHASFRDDGMPEPPARWNGSCTGSRRTRCNRKLIGAKSFAGDYDPEDDEEVGHGTHVASIAAGNFVRGASLGGGLASGTAAGIAPLAHIAVYKVCNRDGCEDSSISCGLDAAVRDGVDVINLSLGSMLKRTFDMDPIAIGAFSAMAKGVLVVSAAGNSGPARYTLCNDAPWMLTVGAGTVDRRFDAELDWEYAPNFASGEALVQDTSIEGVYTLVYCDTCQYTSNIAGKLVLCTAVQRGADQAFIIRRLQHSGAAGVVLIDDEDHGYTTVLRNFDGYNVIQVNNFFGRDLIDYAKTMNPSVILTFTGAVQQVLHSPTVAYFSSRGPSQLSRGLLKPDILAPGLNIIAASSSRVAPANGWSPLLKVMSGTSMAAPHITGVVALLKSVHPDWSPAAIKSAILTTAYTEDNDHGPILDELHDDAPYFTMGAGHVNASRAADPGLVYDLSERDYARYICGSLGATALYNFTEDPSLMCPVVGSIPEAWLNLPTIVVPLKDTPVQVPRTLTNVGPAETYQATVQGPSWMDIRVDPDTLVFSKPGEKKSVLVSVTVNDGEHTRTAEGDFLEGSLIWVSTKHLVRSPVMAVKGLSDHGL